MSTGQVLGTAELNRAVLARQALQRSAGPIPSVLELMGGLQAQYAPSSYTGLWSRRSGKRSKLLKELGGLDNGTFVGAELWGTWSGPPSGTWDRRRALRRGRIVLEPFESLDRSVMAQLEEEAERLAAFTSCEISLFPRLSGHH